MHTLPHVHNVTQSHTKHLCTLSHTTQLRAPGCPVIIVGTHLDAVSAQVAKELEEEAKIKYSNTAIYPKVRVQIIYMHICMGIGKAFRSL